MQKCVVSRPCGSTLICLSISSLRTAGCHRRLLADFISSLIALDESINNRDFGTPSLNAVVPRFPRNSNFAGCLPNWRNLRRVLEAVYPTSIIFPDVIDCIY
uniref:26S proteasome non-ATPase regulatory subunit 4 n=1 Tax=Parascaris univalens TaxID=6257 RepID=A0A914ZZ72_PARUN